MDPSISMVAVIRNFLKDDAQENEMTTMPIEFTELLFGYWKPFILPNASQDFNGHAAALLVAIVALPVFLLYAKKLSSDRYLSPIREPNPKDRPNR